jgi:predicted peptidase
LVSQPPVPADARQGWPLILFLHGAAERGSVVTDVLRQGLPRLLAPDAELTPTERAVGRDVAARFIVIAPQCPPFEVWDEHALLRLLNSVSAEYNVDEKRVYLTGLSMGGFGAWALGLRHPTRFAALAAVCGGGRLSDLQTGVPTHIAALRSMGIWAFHGAHDRVVPLEESQRMVDALHQAGMTHVKFTVYPEAEHNAWTATYANPELYAWMLRHHR